MIKHERIAFIFPTENDLTDVNVLPILAAIQAYEHNAFIKHEAFYRQRTPKPEYKLSITIYRLSACAEFDFIFQLCVDNLLEITDALEFEGYDCVFDMSESRAREIGKHTNKHLAQCYGIICGSDAASLPDVAELLDTWTQTNRILLSVGLMQHILTAAESFQESIGVDFMQATVLAERINAVYQAGAVVGYAGFETYLASCLKKPVCEIGNDPMLTQWTNKNYIRVTSDEDYDLVVRGIKRCLSLIVNTTLTEQETSTVINVESSSAK